MAGNGGTGGEKILLVRVGRGGDVVMITPALDALLAALPRAEFHLLTTEDGRRIMAGHHPRLTGIFTYTRRFPRRLALARSLLQLFRLQGYTRVYIFETKPHYRRWLGGLAPRIHALDGTAADGHYCARCLDLVAGSLAGPVDRGWVRLPVSGEGRDRARLLLQENGVDPETPLVGLHPTFSGTGIFRLRDRRGLRHRMWPAASFARLARQLADSAWDGPRPALVIDALPQEVRFVQPIVEGSGGAVTLLAAPPDFQRYKGLLSLLDVLVTPNTGPMHMAAALNTPLVALFSHWSPADCGPYMDPRRCRVLRAEETADPARGLAAIAPQEVAAAVRDLISSHHK